MASISLRELDDDVIARLKVRAARHGRSIDAEIRAVLTDTVADPGDEQPNLAQAIRQRFAAIVGAELDFPPRSDMPRAVDLPDRS